MSGAQDRVRRRKNLWIEDPHCKWCGVLTSLKGKDKMKRATIDHLKDPSGLIRTTNTVLACYRCNHIRARNGL